MAASRAAVAASAASSSTSWVSCAAACLRPACRQPATARDLPIFGHGAGKLGTRSGTRAVVGAPATNNFALRSAAAPLLAESRRCTASAAAVSQAAASANAAAVAASSMATEHTWIHQNTPNPEVRKFEPPAEQRGKFAVSSLAVRDTLLAVEGVQDVFVAQPTDVGTLPWISVTRTAATSWEALVPSVQAALGTIPVDAGLNQDIKVEVDANEAEAGSIEAEIEEVLTHRVRPAVQADGGDVELVKWDEEEGQVILKLQGACRGCPQSAVTLQEGILRTLQHFVPAVKTVVAEEEEIIHNATGADPTADIHWVHDGQPDAAGIKELSAGGTPFFSTFAGMKVEGPRLRRVQFSSRLQLDGRTPEHVFVSCPECKVRRTIEDPNDLLKKNKGNTTGDAAVVICPSCCVVISR
mmetsp:Transcript_344/g.747  ORF Transcript_344/g.747 Transcript_344/m.747 type:complete len:412 (+) Transcript_344:138-1373(+)|eukprot:CAMPEP_0206467656 /NCGR_PEP_ID=MMETSP0324_2-20121206/29166_1 /ASSEMBLY_ACC=CAM_ASM_000836 /TAXON_ID=2866 /ORGANISM="Crypthecodinium cohnii, Strain Seligo" /LENGTH=411 /DNA_ID=CAMNT_0053940969 /DNA_START=51 /DNA_END=1286 /DNA_ORIENTATION=+